MARADGAHCDPTDLALVAIGESAPTTIFDLHMRSCPSCSAELDALAEVVDLGRAARADRAYAQPPGAVWASVQEAVAAGTPVTASGSSRGGPAGGWLVAALVALVLAMIAIALIVLA